jgi:hypothetical protein
MNREILNLTSQQGRDIVYGDDSNFITIEDKIVRTKRWSIVYEIVVQRKTDGKYFKDVYQRGATESQDEQPYEWSEPNFTEVLPVTKTYIDYE